MTRQGSVGARKATPEVGAEGTGPEVRDTKSSGSKVGGDNGVIEGDAVLAVEVGWVVSCLRNT